MFWEQTQQRDLFWEQTQERDLIGQVGNQPPQRVVERRVGNQPLQRVVERRVGNQQVWEVSILKEDNHILKSKLSINTVLCVSKQHIC